MAMRGYSKFNPFGILDASFLNLTVKKACIKTNKIHRILFQINQLVVFQQTLIINQF
jgi:hypothetical protein